MKNITTTLISILFFTTFFGNLQAQEEPLKEYAEDRKELKLCFYPSTLRMINLANNPDFDHLVGGIEKLLIYNLDSTARAEKSYKQLIPEYEKLGFEEYASAYGGGMNFYVYGKDTRSDSEYIGIISRDETLTVFFMRGKMALANIPKLMQSIGEGDFINPFDFNIEDFGKNTQD